MSKHPPSARRAVIRELKEGGHPAALIEKAAIITDPAHAAAAMMAVACDTRLPATKVAEAIREARRRLAEVDRPARMAEAWADALGYSAQILRGPECTTAQEHLLKEGVQAIQDMPNGQWTATAIEAVAKFLDETGRKRLMRRALNNPGWEVPAAKALLALDESLASIINEQAKPTVAAAVLTRVDPLEALEQAWAIEDPTERREAIRVLAWQTEELHRLGAIAGSTAGKDPEERVAILTMVAGRMDRLGGDASKHFNAAAETLKNLKGKPAIKAHRKLSDAMQRAGMEAPPAPGVKVVKEAPAPEVPVVAAKRHVLALVDGYSGGLAAPHLRAVARAAPLCAAFDLDLALLGFPTTDLDELVGLVEAETNVGEGAGHARALFDDGRLSLTPLDHGVPEAWPGRPIATTPHPDPDKIIDLDGAGANICLLVGLGKQGLPHKMLAAVKNHYELTGTGVSLETATAMGILADRLGRVASQ